MGKTTIVLGLVAVGLLGFILLYEQHTLSTSQLEQRKGRVLQSFLRDRVDKLEVQRQGVTTVLKREREEGEDDEAYGFGSWRVVEPLQAPADEEAVDELLAELEWLQPLRTIQDVDAEDRERFQLDAPRLRVWFHDRDRRIGMAVGADDPQGRGVYAQVLGESKVHVVPKHMIETFDHDPGHYHTKELYALVVPNMVQSLHVEVNGQVASARREEDGWWVDAPRRVLASADRVDSLLRTLTSLRASRYVSADVSKLGAYGLDPAEAVVRFEVDRAVREEADGSKRDPEVIAVHVGAPCEDHAGERYVRADGGPIMCAEADTLEKLQVSPEGLWERKALTIEPTDVARVELKAQGKRLTLEQKEGAWRYERQPAGDSGSGPASQEAVWAWLRELGKVEALRFEPKGSPAAKGALGQPQAVLRLKDDDGELVQTLEIGAEAEDGVWGRRDEAPNRFVFPAEILDLLEPSPDRFTAD